MEGLIWFRTDSARRGALDRHHQRDRLIGDVHVDIVFFAVIPQMKLGGFQPVDDVPLRSVTSTGATILVAWTAKMGVSIPGASELAAAGLCANCSCAQQDR